MKNPLLNIAVKAARAAGDIIIRASYRLDTLEVSQKQPNDYVKYSGMAVQMAAIIVGGVLGGIQLDKWLVLKFPIFTLVLTLFSVFLAIYYFIKDIIKK